MTFSLTAITVIVTSCWVWVDAKTLGLRRGTRRGAFDMDPPAWFLACLMFWIIYFPAYLLKRRRYKANSRISIALLICFVGFIILVAIISRNAELFWGEQRSAVGVAPDIYRTTAQKIFSDYEANEVATDEKIKGKTVEISGTVESIDKDFVDTIVIWLRIDKFNHALISVNDSQKQKAIELNKGMEVTFRCKTMRRIIGSPAGGDCDFWSENHPVPNQSQPTQPESPSAGVPLRPNTLPSKPTAIPATETDAKGDTSNNTNDCELVDGYKIGMSIDDVRAHYSQTSAEPFSCGPALPYVPNRPLGYHAACIGLITFSGVPAKMEFNFYLPSLEETSKGELFGVGGDFDPHNFATVKQAFIERFGKPSADGACDDPDNRNNLRPEDLPSIIQSGGCEGLFWSRSDIFVSLDQLPLGSGQRFSILTMRSKPQCSYNPRD